jgi:protein SCO1/2
MIPENPWWWLTGWLVAFVLNLLFGWLRSDAPRRSSRWFGCLAAPVFLLASLRAALALPWSVALAFLMPVLAGQAIGRRLAPGRPGADAPRWRIAAYGAIMAGLVLMTSAPVRPAGGEGLPAKGYERLALNEPAPPFTLVDQNGRKTSLADFKGQVVVMTFFYSSCVDVCPVLLDALAGAEGMLRAAERDQVRFLAITLDATGDTPDRLKAFLAGRGLNARNWRLLTGDLPEVADVLESYGAVAFPAPGGEIVHNSAFVIVDGKGINRMELHGMVPAEVLVDEIRAVLNQGG